MHDTQLFTITYIYNDTNDKVILMTSGDSLNEASEAEYILSSTNSEEIDLVEFIVSSIPIFAMSEPGSKESITHTAEDFQALYDLPFNEIEERVDEVVYGTTINDVESLLAYTDPSDYMSEAATSEFTQPVDYLEEEEVEETFYAPILTEEDEIDGESLTEAGIPSLGEVLPRFIAELRKLGTVIYPEDCKSIFANNPSVIPTSSGVQVLSMAVSPMVNTGYHLYLDPAGVPYLSSAPVSSIEPSGEPSAIAAPGSVGTLVPDPNKQKQLFGQFI